MAVKKLSERFAAPLTGCRVDREKGVIYAVLVCGVESENNRGYPWGGELKHRPGTYEGKAVNGNHGKGDQIEPVMGWLQNETTDAQGRPRADLHLLKSHPMAERVMEAAEKKPDLFGLSHVAVCRTRVENGREIIEDVQEVESVDIVRRPATTKGFFESANPMKRKLIPLLEALAGRRPAAGKWAKCKVLREMDDSYADGMAGMPAPEDVGDSADATAAGITDAFTSAAMALVSDLMTKTDDAAAIKAGLAKMKKLLLAHGDINGDGKVDAADVDAAEPDGDESTVPTMESKGAKHVLAVLESLTAMKVAPTPANITAVGHIPTEHRAAVLKTLAESVAVKPGEKPTTTTQTPPGKLLESVSNDKTPADDIKTVRFG